MKLTPAKDFIDSEHVRGWQTLISEVQFQEATKAAMLELARRMASSPEAGPRLAGAHEFLDILMGFGESRQSVQRVDTINLART